MCSLNSLVDPVDSEGLTTLASVVTLMNLSYVIPIDSVVNLTVPVSMVIYGEPGLPIIIR